MVVPIIVFPPRSQPVKWLILLLITAFGFFLGIVRRGFKTSFLPRATVPPVRDSGLSHNGLVKFLTHEISWEGVAQTASFALLDERPVEGNQHPPPRVVFFNRGSSDHATRSRRIAPLAKTFSGDE
jgi:hypothetical protein